MLKRLLREVRHRLIGRYLESLVDDAFIRYAKDIAVWRQRNALAETGLFVEQHMPLIRSFPGPPALIDHAISHISSFDDGFVCEFGVATGRSINYIANLLPKTTVYGFDTFEGLPENWREEYPKGSFKMGSLPDVRSNVKLKKGLFSDTLPDFLNECSGRALFLHVDCDLYSSAKDIFNILGSRIVPGTVLVFDEYFNYPGWREGEYKAFMEFIEKTGYGFEYLGYCRASEQVAIKIKRAHDSGKPAQSSKAVAEVEPAVEQVYG